MAEGIFEKYLKESVIVLCWIVQLILLYTQAKLTISQEQNYSDVGLDGLQIKLISILVSHNSKPRLTSSMTLHFHNISNLNL